MSFTLRNLFSEEDGEPGAEWPGAAGEDGSRENAPAGRDAAEPQGQAYLVSEILPFIPPAIVAGGRVPMEKEVRIPLGKDGATDVPLSMIFRQCPELFAAEITPLNDSVVTLPVKLGKAQVARKVGSSIFDAPSTPFGSPGFGLSAEETDSSASEAEDNPFWSPGADDATATAAPPIPEKQPDSGFSGGFAAEVSQKDEGNAFGEPPPPPDQETPAPAGGFSAPEETGKVNPFGDGPAPASGASSSGFSGNPFDSTESFSTLFSSKAEEDADIPFPVSGNDESTWGAMFESDLDEGDAPVSEAVAPGLGEMIKREDVNNRKADPFGTPPPGATPAAAENPASESTASPAPETTASPVPEKTASQAHAFAGESPPEPTPVNEGSPEASPASPFSAFASPFASPYAGPVADPVAATAPGAGTFGDPTPVPPEGVSPSLPQAEEKSTGPGENGAGPEGKGYHSVRETVPPPLEAPVAGNSVEVEEEELAPGKAPSMPGEMEVSFRDLEFRAIFSSDESFTLAKVARHVVGLAGVSACALATTAKLVQASRNEQSRLGDEAREMVDAIRNLAKLTGLPEARAFTLQTDRGTVSLFLEGDCCVTVNHDTSGFGPGVREKLILIARNIHKLQE